MRQLKSRTVIATENAKFFHFLSKELARDRFKFNHVKPGDVDAQRYSRDTAIITTSSEVSALSPGPLILSYDEDQYPMTEHHVRNFYHMFRILMDTGIDECNQIDIGIDPGSKHTGLALFLNGTFIEATVIPTSDARIREFVGTSISMGLHNCKEGTSPAIRVKIGNGNPVEMHKIVSLLLKMQQQGVLEILVVDESRSNTEYVINDSNFIKIGDHALAAVNIALREGIGLEHALKTREYKPGVRRHITRKQVKNIQAESRVASGCGGITIDQRLATKVLLGKLSLEEAIALYKQSGKDKINGMKGTPGTS